MKRCSEFAYSICPDRFVCGNLEDAVFVEGSECDEFNKPQNAVAFCINEISASCEKHAANALQMHVKETLDRIERGLEELNVEN